MADREWRTQLRAAVYRGDAGALIRLTGPDRTSIATALQLIGDGLTQALSKHTEAPHDKDAAVLATDCVGALADRDWPGDTDLREQLQAALGTGPSPSLRPLPVDLAELADTLEGDPTHGGGLLDLHTGEVWPQAAIDYAQENSGEIAGAPDENDDPDRWLPVPCTGSREGYRDMEIFINMMVDPNLADRLRIASQGHGAFRRFKDVLADTPNELDQWFAFCEERRRGRARAWLTDSGYTPLPASTTANP